MFEMNVSSTQEILVNLLIQSYDKPWNGPMSKYWQFSCVIGSVELSRSFVKFDDYITSSIGSV